MRAALVRSFGPPETLEIADVAAPSPGEGEVLIAIGAVSVNYPDVLLAEGTYQELPDVPFSPGMDVAGTVVGVGSGASRVRCGDRVLALIQHGGFAEQVCAPEHAVTLIPDDVEFAAAAALGLAALTAYVALLQRAQLKPGDRVLVTGAGGGVGAAAIQIAKAHGATVIACARSKERRDLATRLGADTVLASTPESLRDDVMSATGGQGIDVVIDMVGGAYLSSAIRCTAWEGRIVVVGFASGEQNPIKPGHLLVKNIAVMGLQVSDYRDRRPEFARAAMTEIFRLVGHGRVDPALGGTLPLEEAAEGLRRVKDGLVDGKLVLITNIDGGSQ